MSGPPRGLDPARFLRRHWQKRWLYLPSALHRVPTLLSPDVLAGLACEVEVESRLILRHGDDWEVRHGPFDAEEFARLPADRWTLLVQNVEAHLPELYPVLEAFSFLPTWRVDDLMVSYSAPGGTVGAHIDAYDVFLVQGMGAREWQLDPAPDDCSYRPDQPLPVLRAFRPRETIVMQPGDLLYLPPGVAHFGVGATEAMTWSIGFRAPSVADLLHAGAAMQEGRDPQTLYTDADLSAPECRGSCIDLAAATRIRRLLADAMAMDDAQLIEMLGRAATRVRPWLRPEPPETSVTAASVRQGLDQGRALVRHPASRMAWSATAEQVMAFGDGGAWHLDTADAGFVAYVAETGTLDAALLLESAGTADAFELLAALVTQGTLRWDDAGPAPTGDDDR